MDPDAILGLYTVSLVFFLVGLIAVRWARRTAGVRAWIDGARVATCADSRQGEWVHLTGEVGVNPVEPPLGEPVWLREIEQKREDGRWTDVMDRCEPGSFLLSDETGTARVPFRGALWMAGPYGTQIEEVSQDRRLVTGITTEGIKVSVIGRVSRNNPDRAPYRVGDDVLDIVRSTVDPVIIVASGVPLDYFFTPARRLRRLTVVLAISGVVSAVLLVAGLCQGLYGQCLASTVAVMSVVGLIWWCMIKFAGTKFSPFLHEAE